MKIPKFVDHVTIHVVSGAGGNGCASFRREKFVPKGGPDGGDGGRGGHVILEGNRDDNSLVRLYFAPLQRARDAGPGRGQQQHGRNGQDLVLKVPLGTEVRQAPDGILLGDIVEHGQQVVVARGGRGGLGNCHWKSSTHQAPREHTDGEPSQELDLELTLRLIAGAGLVGYPNAGKSSLLADISDAHPKVAAYPFTTLNPIVGTVFFEDYTRLTVADIPGLIKGAHEGVGLGHAFLRHIERARFLVFVIDMAGVDGRKPWEDYASLREELGLHMPDLLQRPSLLVANKMDLPEAQAYLPEFVDHVGEEPLPVSAKDRTGTDVLKQRLSDLSRHDAS